MPRLEKAWETGLADRPMKVSDAGSHLAVAIDESKRYIPCNGWTNGLMGLDTLWGEFLFSPSNFIFRFPFGARPKPIHRPNSTHPTSTRQATTQIWLRRWIFRKPPKPPKPSFQDQKLPSTLVRQSSFS